MSPNLQVLQKIGQGSQGSVYKAKYKELQELQPQAPEWVAVKKVAIPRTVRERERVQNEIEMLKRLPDSVPVCIHLIDSYKESFPETQCIVTDLVEGTSFSTTKRTLKEAAHWIRGLLRFVATCHANQMAHRDLKPANFLVCKNGLIGIDMGMATLTEEGMCEGGVGTPLYMSPESIRAQPGELIDGFKSDIYSIGVMAYEMITGRHPYDNGIARTPEDFLKLIPSEGLEDASLVPLIRRMLDPDPTKRPTVFEALQDPWLISDDTYKNGSFFLYLQ